MPEHKEIRRTLIRRLMPLYIACFFQGFVFWYSIEKLFMHTIGFSNAAIGAMVAVYSFVILLVNAPSGILADRWSRKGVLILASISLTASSVIGGLSHSMAEYLVAAVLWGAFYACYSGVYDSIIYDVVAEARAPKRLFEYLYGRWQAVDGVALVLASLLGGLIAARINLRAAYFMTAPIGIFSIWALLAFREPTLHRDHEVMTIRQQLKVSFRAVLKNRSLLPVVSVLVLEVVLFFGMVEFAQLWLLALHVKTGYFGIANAILLLSLAIGGYSVERLHVRRYSLAVGLILLMIGTCSMLVISRNVAVIVAAQFLYTTCLINIYIIFSRILHDNLSPAIRAGASSAAGTVGRFIIIPIALLMGYISQRYSIYRATYILIVLVLLMSLFIMTVANRNDRNGLEPDHQ